MMARVLFFAPSTPPLTGASTKLTPRSPRKVAAQRAVSALTVEQSTTSAPRARPGAMSSITERTSVSAETQITAASIRPANSGRVAGAATPSSAPSDRALSALRFQTAASSPAL